MAYRFRYYKWKIETKVDFEALKVRGKELGSVLINAGRVEEALNILRALVSSWWEN